MADQEQLAREVEEALVPRDHLHRVNFETGESIMTWCGQRKGPVGLAFNTICERCSEEYEKAVRAQAHLETGPVLL